ncbi:hypothetical protein [Azospirillum sp. Sh1]|uniref:hypothetical protein n=1 Tax=Azospirillum sp. Sh1 TaxID=2607285 RepID=UPI0011EEFD40|nr:hypothetical protein [Azospirillum sp. Sh1]KAA0570262.1 hypothetical protein FZ029_31115 [Azospirillum sp. Sh1]
MGGSSVSDGVVIDLSKRLDVRELGDRNELIQQQALERLSSLIEKRLNDFGTSIKPTRDDLDADGSNILFDRRHDTIVIHGSRGSGKTTFIRNAFRLFRLDKGFDKTIGSKVATLGVVDPTLIENKENIFVVILNKIKRAVERRREASGDWNTNKEDFNAWQEKLRSLAHGLSLLEGIGPEKALGDAWDDVQYVLRKGLEKASAGSDLESKFHDFIASSLTYLGKDAFLIALDDIDTDFRRGWPVLEVLRRYLTSPRIIVVLSGDIDLYTLLVRGKQWDQFSERQLHFDKTQEKGLREMVNHLQGQYMLKVLPPRNRIPLLPLDAIDGVHLVPPDGDKAVPLDAYMRALVRGGLGLRSKARRMTTSLLLRQPVRTVVQILSLCPARAMPPAGADAAAESADWRELVNGLPSIFLDSLLRHNTSLDELRQATGGRTLGFIAKFLTENDLWDNAHDLLPEHPEDDLNLVLVTLGAWLRGQYLNRPNLAIDYMLRVCFGRDLLTSYLQGLRIPKGDEDDDKAHKRKGLKVADFVKFAELEREGSSVEVARTLVAVINGDPGSGVRLGTIQTYKRGRSGDEIIKQIYGIAPVGELSFERLVPEADNPILPFHQTLRKEFAEATLDKPIELLGNWYNTIDSLQARITTETMSALVGLPACRVMKESGERPTFMSVHSIIAAVADLLRRGNSGQEDGVVRTLRDFATIRSYVVPPWISRDAGDSGLASVSEASDAETEVTAMRDDILVKHISDWTREIKAVAPPPPYVLARAWTRFYFTLAAIDEEVDRNDRFLGYLLHRQICAFFNALLVEELIYEKAEEINLRNPVTSDAVLSTNLRIADKAPFFTALFKCPLWSVYLNLDSAVGKQQCERAFSDSVAGLRVPYNIRQLSRQAETSKGRKARPTVVTFPNLYPLLNSVPVFGLARKPPRTFTQRSGGGLDLEF